MTFDARTLKAAAHATLHCAIGCVAGEVVGLATGVQLGLGPWLSMGLATVLAFVFGLSLATFPLARSQGIAPLEAFEMIWLGEVVSIGAMELAMNATDYALGGASVGSIADPLFWAAMGAAIPAGYLAALPVNYVMIARGLNAHHGH